ncbi:MAG: glycosyltransferase, partial [Sphingosinicella sp.]|uniref:glycosyltransferase n=1 Tax=Sphingosinicella sp. TaxID=1917971 RepID=UPI0040378D9D
MTGLPTVAIFRSPVFNRSETFIRAQAASPTRYRPLIVGLEDKGNVPDALADRLVLAEGTWRRLTIKLFGRWGALAEEVRTYDPALVHAHFGPDGLLALPLARALGVPLVTTLHGYDIGRSPRDMLLSGRLSWQRYALRRRRLMREGRLFIAVSDALRERALVQGFPAERTVTHRIGVDLARFRPSGAAEPGLVLHVGRLVEKKGTALLLEAFAKARAAR